VWCVWFHQVAYVFFVLSGCASSVWFHCSLLCVFGLWNSWRMGLSCAGWRWVVAAMFHSGSTKHFFVWVPVQSYHARANEPAALQVVPPWPDLSMPLSFFCSSWFPCKLVGWLVPILLFLFSCSLMAPVLLGVVSCQYYFCYYFWIIVYQFPVSASSTVGMIVRKSKYLNIAQGLLNTRLIK
jgi:hypothetical protein